MAALGLVCSAAGEILAQNSSSFIHVATENNSNVNVTMVASPLLNFKPNSAFLFTHNYSAKGVVGARHDKKMGWYYSGTSWYLFNQDKSDLDTGLAFNVLAPDADTKSWIFTADSSNSSGNYAWIDHPAINGDSSAIIFVNDVWNVNGTPKGVYNLNTIGVFYNKAKKKWCIFHQDQTQDMVKNSSYSIVIPEKSSSIIRMVHRSKAANVVGLWTEIDHPSTNNNPDAHIFVTQNWNPNGGAGKYNNHEVGVYYTGSKWAIYNEDVVKMDTGVSFNVMIFPNTTANTNHNTMNSQVHFFPNPVANGEDLELNIQHPATGLFTLCITDLTGKKWLERTIDKRQADYSDLLPISGFPKGVYILQIAGDEFHSVQRLMVE